MPRPFSDAANVPISMVATSRMQVNAITLILIVNKSARRNPDVEKIPPTVFPPPVKGSVIQRNSVKILTCHRETLFSPPPVVPSAIQRTQGKMSEMRRAGIVRATPEERATRTAQSTRPLPSTVSSTEDRPISLLKSLSGSLRPFPLPSEGLELPSAENRQPRRL